MESRSTLASVEFDERVLRLRWDNAEVSRIPYIWLRDNCSCDQCGTTATGRRFLRLIDIPEDISPDRAELDEGSVVIHWGADGHQSRYESSWLREHCEDAPPIRRPWGAEIPQSLSYRSFGKLLESEDERLDLVEHIYLDGLVLVDGVEGGSTKRLGELLGPIRGYSYEPVSDIMLEPPPPGTEQQLANTGTALAPHLDEPFRNNQPGLLLLHCVAAAPGGGGENLLVDGFKVAAELRERAPEAFELLCRIPTGFRRKLGEEFNHYTERPVFSLDASGQVTRFCFAERSAAPVRAPASLMEPIYAARRALMTLIHDKSLQAKVALRPGDAFIVDNHRVMHGRTAFEGARHLRHCHVDQDEVYSRYRMACRRLGRIPVNS